MSQVEVEMNILSILVKTYLTIEKTSLNYIGKKIWAIHYLHRNPVVFHSCLKRLFSNECKESTRKELKVRVRINEIWSTYNKKGSSN